MPRLFRQQPVQHRTEGCDAGSRRNKNRVLQRRPQNKIAEWTLAGNLVSFFHGAQKVRHEAILHAIEAEYEMLVIRGRGGNRICARDFFAAGCELFEREPLSGYKAEPL